MASCTAFAGDRRIASGDSGTVALAVKEATERGEPAPLLIFDDATGEQVEFDLRGTDEEVLARLPGVDESTDPPGPRGPGRPRLGVVAREVTLLPRHWEWLNGQPGGASVALRKLVEEARRANEGVDRARRARDAAYRFMSAMAGNRPCFEEAARALFADDPARFAAQIQDWPADIQGHLARLVADAMPLTVAAAAAGGSPGSGRDG